MAEWSNWAGNVRAYAVDVHTPADVGEVSMVVAATAAAHRRIRPVGSGHSLSAIGSPADQQLRLDRLSGIIGHDPVASRVRVGAGTPLRELNESLWRLGLALPNLGDFDGQTLAGALSTGTHGTGLAHRGMAAAVVGVELVIGSGEVLRIDQEHHAELLPAVAIGLGALGVVTEYELQCVPAFLLHAEERPDRLGAVLETLTERIEGSDHFEFYWFPHTDRVLTKTNTRVADLEQAAPLPPWRQKLDDDLLANTALDGLNRIGKRLPVSIPLLNRLAGAAVGTRSYTDRSYRVFCTDRTVRFTESEFAIPLHTLPAAIRALQSWFSQSGERVAFPLEVRFAEADDLWLSSAHSRRTAYLAVHQYHSRPYEPYFPAFWEIMRAVGGRPHWGKLHNRSQAQLARLFPRLDDFRDLRERFDPERTFGNAYLERVLGR